MQLRPKQEDKRAADDRPDSSVTMTAYVTASRRALVDGMKMLESRCRPFSGSAPTILTKSSRRRNYVEQIQKVQPVEAQALPGLFTNTELSS